MSWVNEQDVVQRMESAGLLIEGLRVGTVKPVRCKVDGEKGKKGWYHLDEMILDTGERIIIGAYGIWRGTDNNKQPIPLPEKTCQQCGAVMKITRKTCPSCKSSEASVREISKEERARIRKRLAEQRSRLAEQEAREKARAARIASIKYRSLRETGESGYLKRKQVGAAPGVRFTRDGAIAVPMMDVHGGVHGIQFILDKDNPAHKKKIERLDGKDKRFWPKNLGLKGNFFLIGSPPARGDVLLVAEGYATGMSIHEATGLSVAVVFTANNIAPSIENLIKAWRCRIMICADDDYLCRCIECGHQVPVAEPPDGPPQNRELAPCANCGKPHGKTNAGIVEAMRAASDHRGKVCWVPPRFESRRNPKTGKWIKWTDFNDLAVHESPLAVAAQLRAAIDRLPGHGAVAEDRGAGAPRQGGGDEKPYITFDEAVERYYVVRNAKDLMFDSVRRELVPKSCVLDYVTPDHAWRQWKTDPRRKNVFLEQIGFDPTESDPNIICNYWKGMPLKPDSSGSCDAILEVLKHLCSAEKSPREVYEWVLRWLAYPLQHQGAKMRTALVFHGEEGVGKNLFFEAIATIYGEYGRIIDQSALDDQFNDWLSAKLFLIANEVLVRSEIFHQRNKIKGLITEDSIRIRTPYVKSMWEKNHANIVFLSNEVQPVAPGPKDRRFMVVATPDKPCPDLYKAAAEEIRNGGVAALYHHLLHVDLGDFNEHTKPLMTDSKRALIEVSKESPTRFIDQWLGGMLDIPPQACALRDLYRAYERWIRDEGERFAYSKIKFSALARRHPDLSIAEKPVLQANGKTKVMACVLPDCDPKPDGETWMNWLGRKYADFRHALEDSE